MLISNDFEKELGELRLLDDNNLENFRILKELLKNEISKEDVELVDPSIIITDAEQIAFISYLIIADCTYYEVFTENLINKIIDELISNQNIYEEKKNYNVKELIRYLIIFSSFLVFSSFFSS